MLPVTSKPDESKDAITVALSISVEPLAILSLSVAPLLFVSKRIFVLPIEAKVVALLTRD